MPTIHELKAQLDTLLNAYDTYTDMLKKGIVIVKDKDLQYYYFNSYGYQKKLGTTLDTTCTSYDTSNNSILELDNFFNEATSFNFPCGYENTFIQFDNNKGYVSPDGKLYTISDEDICVNKDFIDVSETIWNTFQQKQNITSIPNSDDCTFVEEKTNFLANEIERIGQEIQKKIERIKEENGKQDISGIDMDKAFRYMNKVKKHTDKIEKNIQNVDEIVNVEKAYEMRNIFQFFLWMSIATFFIGYIFKFGGIPLYFAYILIMIVAYVLIYHYRNMISYLLK